jgi:hypothetical protein
MWEKVKTWIKKKALNTIGLGQIVEWLNGKKTILGSIQLLLWIAVVAVPIIFPEYLIYAEYAKKIAEELANLGIPMDFVLVSGTGTTAIGLINKILKTFGWSPETPKILEIKKNK